MLDPCKRIRLLVLILIFWYITSSLGDEGYGLCSGSSEEALLKTSHYQIYAGQNGLRVTSNNKVVLDNFWVVKLVREEEPIYLIPSSGSKMERDSESGLSRLTWQMRVEEADFNVEAELRVDHATLSSKLRYEFKSDFVGKIDITPWFFPSALDQVLGHVYRGVDIRGEELQTVFPVSIPEVTTWIPATREYSTNMPLRKIEIDTGVGIVILEQIFDESSHCSTNRLLIGSEIGDKILIDQSYGQLGTIPAGFTNTVYLNLTFKDKPGQLPVSR